MNPNSIVNLTRANVLVVDENPFSLKLMAQILMGFGVRNYFDCRSMAEAVELLTTTPVDLVLVDCDLADGDGYDLAKWLRRSKVESDAHAPVIMMSSHTKVAKVRKSRDCGANYTLARPFSPATLMERILWVAKDRRPFLAAGDFIGPDRRINDSEPPRGEERRADRIASGASKHRDQKETVG